MGTTNIKALLLDADQGVIGLARQPAPITEPQAGWAIYEPEQLWQIVCRTVQQVMHEAQIDAGDIRGVSVASMGEAGLPVDRHGKALYPIISWLDDRTQPLVSWWEQHVDADRVYQETGLALHHIYGVNKWMWIRDHAPKRLHDMHCWLSVGDYIITRLTGTFSTDYTLASRTMLFDQREHDWLGWIADVATLDPALLPSVSPSGTIAGEITADAATETHLSPGTAVIRGGHDQLCVAFALGVDQPGQYLNAMGTAEVILTPVVRFQPTKGLQASRFSLGSHIRPGLYYAMAGILASGAALKWYCEYVNCEAWENTAAQLSPGSDGLCFVPHLKGSGPPSKDARARGIMVGLSLDHTPAHGYRALLEGLSFELYRVLKLLERETGVQGQELLVSSSGIRNDLWNQIKADIVGLPIRVIHDVEMTAYAAAFVAAYGLQHADLSSLRDRLLSESTVFYPTAAHHERYSELYQAVFEELYERLRDVSHALYSWRPEENGS